LQQRVGRTVQLVHGHSGTAAHSLPAVAYPPGHVSPKRTDRLAAAADNVKKANAELSAAIMDALNHGGSFRVIGEITGLSSSGVRAIAQRAGYTSEKFFADRQRQRAERDEWADKIGMPEFRSKPDGSERKGKRKPS
jgi:hypothetical protein